MAWEGHQADTQRGPPRPAVGVLVMAKRSRRKKTQPPKFPRHRWLPGQVERADAPEKGGPYDRARKRQETDKEIEDAQEQP